MQNQAATFHPHAKTGNFHFAESDPKDYYESNGYYLWRSLIPETLIDRLVQRYVEEIVSSTYPFFRQNTDAYEANKLTSHGYVQQSFLDIHDYNAYPEFSQYARDIFTSQEIREALKKVTGFDSFNLMQTMLFDANTETVPHQDWWYLDSVPNGFLLAAWIALEDIDERAGRFFVIPGSISVDLHSDTPDLKHTEWLEHVARYVDEHRKEIYAPALKKGDVLFWNSRTIHGSLPTIDPRFSRKSLTAHYLPGHMAFGNLFVKKDYIAYNNYNGMRFYRNQPDYSLANKVKSVAKNILYDSPTLMRNLRKVQQFVKSNQKP